MRKRGVVIIALMGLACVVAAHEWKPMDEVLRLRQQGEIMSLETIITIAAKRYPDARLLEVEFELNLESNNYHYEVELLTKDGIVRELTIDATSGKILLDEED